MITLAELCMLTGATRRAIQGFENAGLLSKGGKNKYGYSLYDNATVEKVRRILMYQRFGFTVKEIVVFDELPSDEQREWLLRKEIGLLGKKEEIEESIELIRYELRKN